MLPTKQKLVELASVGAILVVIVGVLVLIVLFPRQSNVVLVSLLLLGGAMLSDVRRKNRELAQQLEKEKRDRDFERWKREELELERNPGLR